MLHFKSLFKIVLGLANTAPKDIENNETAKSRNIAMNDESCSFFVNQQHEQLSVHGYTRKIGNEFADKNAYYNIPFDIINMIIIYYWDNIKFKTDIHARDLIAF